MKNNRCYFNCKIMSFLVLFLIISLIGCTEQNSIVSLEVNLREIDLSQISPDDKDKVKILWERIGSIIPDAYLDKINLLEIVNDKNDGKTASVAPNNNQWSSWLYSVNLADVFEKDVLKSDINATLLHEFAHILSLEASQHKSDDEVQDGQFSYESIVLSDTSYLNRFYQTFWLDIIDEHKEILGEGEYSPDKLEDLISFYDKYEDQFVSDYAAYNAAEDFAECFYLFVLQDKLEGERIKDKKITFFYNDPDLLAIRNEIRNQLD